MKVPCPVCRRRLEPNAETGRMRRHGVYRRGPDGIYLDQCAGVDQAPSSRDRASASALLTALRNYAREGEHSAT